MGDLTLPPPPHRCCRVALASCSRQLRQLLSSQDPLLWRSVRLAVAGGQIYEPSLEFWLEAKRGVLQELSLVLTGVDAGPVAAIESTLSLVASACSGGPLCSLSLTLHGKSEAPFSKHLALSEDSLQLGALPHLESLALAVHTGSLLEGSAVELRGLSALTSLQLSGDLLDFSTINLPASLRHLAVPKEAAVYMRGWLMSMEGVRLCSMHVDAMPVDDSEAWDPDLDEDEEEPDSHSLGLAILGQPGWMPNLRALSLNLEAGEPFGLPMVLSDAAALAPQLRALAAVHFPPCQAPVLASLTALTRLWITSSAGRLLHSIRQLGGLPSELSQLARLRELTVEGAGDISTLAPLLPLKQLSSLALPACGLQQQAVDGLLALPALQASAAGGAAACGGGAPWGAGCT